MVTGGWVVLHSSDPGGSGDVVGHAVPDQNVFVTDLSVALDSSYWTSGTENRSIWAVLHHDADGNGKFDASSDPPIGGRDDPAHAVRLDVRTGDRSAFVLAEQERAQRTNASTVVIRRAHLPEDGYLVARANEDGTPGTIVGFQLLGAGAHVAAPVNVSEHFYHHQPEEFSLWAVVYRSDGDGQFDDGDKPVSVNGSMVASHFRVNRTGEIDPGHTHTPSETRTPVATATHSTSTHHDDHDHANQTESPSTQTIPTTAMPATPTAGASGPGMGFEAVVLTLLLGLGFGRFVVG